MGENIFPGDNFPFARCCIFIALNAAVGNLHTLQKYL